MKNSTNFNRLSVLTIILFSLFTMNSSWAQCVNPVNVTAITEYPTSANFTWEAYGSESGVNYQWEIRTANDPGTLASGYVLSGSVANGTNSVTITGLDFFTQYYFYIRYKCTATPTYSPWQATGSNPFITLSLQVPTATAGILISSTYFTAKWNPVFGASSYRIDVSDDPNFTTTLASYTNVTVNAIYLKVTGLTPNTNYYYRVRAVGTNGSGTFITSSSTPKITVKTTVTDTGTSIWNGTIWINGNPNFGKDAIIDADYNTSVSGTIDCKTLLINSGKKLTIESIGTGSTDGRYVRVYGSIINEAGITGIVVESSGNLLQVGTSFANSGAITVKRNSNPLWRLDYTMWSSPVSGSQTLGQFSPDTSPTRFSSYDTFSDKFFSIPSSTIPAPGSGYLIRMPNNWVSNAATVVDPLNPPTPTGPAAIWPGNFIGVANASPVTITLSTKGNGYNMVGNPYPSAINAGTFLGGNVSTGDINGTLYFWRRTNNDDPLTQTASSYYATYTTAGGVASGDTPSIKPNSLIAKGQGFIVKVNDFPNANPTVKFTNYQRATTYPAQFMKKANKEVVDEEIDENDDLERNRLWLNLTSAEGGFGQTLVAYMTGASNGLDESDGKYIFDNNYMNDDGTIADGALALTSYLDKNEYIIQARALPFNEDDIVPLLFKTPKAGDYAITLDQIDGLFAEGQAIYIKDNVTKTINNLNEKPYNFSTEAGVFDKRFEVVYNTSSLSTKNPTLDANAVVVYKSNQALNINSGAIAMKSVELYDMSGRMIYKKGNIDNTKLALSNLNFQDQIIIIKITTAAGIVNKKFSFTR